MRSAVEAVAAALRPLELRAAAEDKQLVVDNRCTGEAVLDLDPGQRSHLVSTCLDRPGSQLFLRTPREELAAARRLHGSHQRVEVSG